MRNWYILKICPCCPLKKTKQPHDIIKGFNIILENIGNPKYLYTDQEGSFYSIEFVKLLNKHKIEHLTSLSPASYIEVFIRTFKNMIDDRLKGMNFNKNKWVDMIEPVLYKYNNTTHSTTEFKPVDAKLKENKLSVWWNLSNKAKRDRIYEDINKGDYVRKMIKKTTFRKGTDDKWTNEKYKVLINDNNNYIINDNARKRYHRHEFL